MAKAVIISIGNEILSGLTIDTNSSWISARLMEQGIETAAVYTMPDLMDEITGTLRVACLKGQIIIVTGGLGPTDDDLTREAMAEFLGVPLEFNQKLMDQIEVFFKKRNYKLSDTNRKQAYLPKSAAAIENKTGTAPGILFTDEEKIIAALPGVPVEMKGMFLDSVLPLLGRYRGDSVILTKKIRCFGIGESNIAQMLGGRMKRGRNPYINSTASEGINTLHVVANGPDRESASDMIETECGQICEIMGSYVYGFEDETLPQVVAGMLINNNLTISTAESCTGGLISKMLTDIPGSSGYFGYGWVTYSNEAKLSQLAVDPGLIEKYGAVSPQVAQAMVLGAQKVSNSDISIAVTGIAGPGGGTEEKPAGLVYIASIIKGKTEVKKYIFPHNRQYVRLRTALTALNTVRLGLY